MVLALSLLIDRISSCPEDIRSINIDASIIKMKCFYRRYYMEKPIQDGSDSPEVPNILCLPTEIVLYIMQFLTEARDRVKVLYVSRRLRSIGLTPSLWREFVWPHYNYLEKGYLFGLLKSFGKHVERLSFPQHVMLPRQAVESVPHLPTAKRMHGLVDVLYLCSNLTHLSLSIGPHLTSEQLREVVYNMKCLEVLEVNLPRRGLSSGKLVVHADNTFQLLFSLAVKLKELKICLEISRLQMKDLQNWINQGFNPPTLTVLLYIPVQQLMLKNDLLHLWAQWNSQVPAGHTACLRIYHYLKAPLNLFDTLPVFQLQYGSNATLPFVKASSVGILGLSKDLILLTDGTCGNKTMYKAEIDKTVYDTHNIVCSDSNIDTFSLVNELDISRCDVQSDHLTKIATTCPHLQRLNLQINQPHCLSIEGMQMIARHCCDLKGLNLSGIPVNDIQFCIKIWEILSTMMLTYLSINILFFIRPLTEDDMYKKQLSTLFKRFITLRALELYCNCRTTRRDYELQHYFPALQYCRLNLVQHPTCVQEILITCKNLTCFSCHSNVQLQLSAPACLNNLQQLCIVSQDNMVDDNFMDTVSAHGKLVHVFFKVHSMLGEGIITLVKNSTDLLTFTVCTKELIGFSYESDLKLLTERFSDRKLFKFGMLNLAPLDVDPDYLLRNTDLLPLWPFRL